REPDEAPLREVRGRGELLGSTDAGALDQHLDHSYAHALRAIPLWWREHPQLRAGSAVRYPVGNLLVDLQRLDAPGYLGEPRMGPALRQRRRWRRDGCSRENGGT